MESKASFFFLAPLVVFFVSCGDDGFAARNGEEMSKPTAFGQHLVGVHKLPVAHLANFAQSMKLENDRRQLHEARKFQTFRNQEILSNGVF